MLCCALMCFAVLRTMVTRGDTQCVGDARGKRRGCDEWAQCQDATGRHDRTQRNDAQEG